MTGEDGSQPPLSQLGPYELIRPIAQGGMADIYLAKRVDAQFDRRVAIKVLNKLRATEAESRAMFQDEARLVGMLSHQNIASILEVDVADGHHYLAMEYVNGADLRELLSTAAKAGRTLPFEVSLSIVVAAAAGLDHAHRRCSPDGTPLKLVHRDVSLSNIMVAHDGAVKVVDFGIASTAIQSIHTSPGVVRGKASYMSPEQCLGDEVDHKTDIFALGVVLYELTTNARCFAGKSDFERMLSVVKGQYHAPQAIVSNYPIELEAVVRKALSADPADRYASCAAMIEALEEVARARSWTLGFAPIERVMQQLYGLPEGTDVAIAPPFSVGEATQPSVFAFEQPEGAEPTARETPSAQRRIAQGTNADGYAPPLVTAPDDDDQPTRGRRPLPRRPSLPNITR
jgi:serine/threonine protein kinase